jgi:hypothetical protein
VMPAGRRDANYQTALANIDWKKLYTKEEGFLLFEDAKAQWEQEFKPDYVLIDSRTGHTDVEGICTRQLPDSVVLMFMPNEQNLAGLEGVTRAIRSEATEGLRKIIHLYFVASNVPNLDDEERVLHRQMRAFRERLKFKHLSGVIRRYESMSLLNQSIFTLDRPHTRLARAYRRLVRRFLVLPLLMEGFEDRDRVLLFLQTSPESQLSAGKYGFRWLYEKALREIARRFEDDVEIMQMIEHQYPPPERRPPWMGRP